jgi:hypothetical protein
VRATAPVTTGAPRRASRSGTKAPAAETVETPAESELVETELVETENENENEVDSHLSQAAATDLLVRALRIVENRGDEDWAGNSQVKNQMLRMDSSFKEKSLGYKSFTAFVDSRSAEVEVKDDAPTNQPRLRLRADERPDQPGN